MANSLSADDWRAVLELSHAAAELPEHERLPFLESSGSSPEVIGEVLALLGEDSPPVAPVLREGARVGHFVIGALLGRGGMGEVWAARDTDLDRTVALKFLTPEVLGLHGAAEKFIREARTASALNHPNIVVIHEVLRSESTVAIVMEFVEGTPLRQLCGAALPVNQVADIGRQIAQALVAAQAAGIVHRDIKPENIIVRQDGRVKVLDFGLARWVAPGGESTHGTSSGSLPAGTWRYMAPEQAKGRKVTGATDIFSLGLVLFELCTGQHPFPAGSAFEALQAIVSARAAAPPSALNAGVPKALDALILAMLSKDPAARPDAETVGRTLERLQSASAVPTAATRRAPQRYAMLVAAVPACLAILAGAAALWSWRSRTPGGKEPLFEQVTTLVPENRATAAAISPDGRLMAYANVDGIFVRASGDGETHPLPAPSDFVADRLAWFPDDTKLVASGFSTVTNFASIWTISVTGGSPRLLRNQAIRAIPSPDGTAIAFLNRDQSEIWIMGTSGEEARRVVGGPGDDTFPLVFWIPNGRRLAFQRRHYTGKQEYALAFLDQYYQRSYETADLTTGKLLAKTPGIWINSAAALQDGRVLYLRYPPGSDRCNELWEARTDPATGAFRGAPRMVANPLGDSLHSDNLDGMSATADGRRVMVLRRADSDAVFVGDLEGSPPRVSHVHRLTLDQRASYPHAWTADSRAVIFESDRNGGYDIFKQRPDQRTPDTIVATPLAEVMPQLTPDGRAVLYAARADGLKPHDYKLMRVPVAGGTPEEVPIGGRLDEFRCALNLGRRCVLRTSVEGHYYAFHELDPIRGKGRELARTAWIPEIFGDWGLSPDGTQVAIPNHDAHSARIRVLSLEAASQGPREREIELRGLSNLSGVVWAPDGKAWFVSMVTDLGRRLLYVDAGGGRLGSLGDIQGWAVPSPDGRRVAFLNRTVATNAWMITRH